MTSIPVSSRLCTGSIYYRSSQSVKVTYLCLNFDSILYIRLNSLGMERIRETLQMELIEVDKIQKSLEISSDSVDEPMNEGNGNLLDSPEEGGVPQERLDPSLETAIKEATLKLVELSEGNSILIRMSEFNVSSSPSSNVVPSIGDNLLESYLIGDADRRNDSTRCIENVSKIDNCLISSPVKTSRIVYESSQLSVVAVTTDLYQTSTVLRLLHSLLANF